MDQQVYLPFFHLLPQEAVAIWQKYHTSADAPSGLFHDLEIVERKDQPQEVCPEFDEMGTTVGLLICLTKKLWSTGKIERKNLGVFALAHINKRHYWPKYVDGESIKAHLINKEVGAVDEMHDSFDGVKVFIFAMKEPDNVMALMLSYRINRQMGEEKFWSWHAAGRLSRISFKYPQVVYNHYKYWHNVDKNNSKRQSSISVETMWATKRWECCVFAFLLAVTEVNIMLACSFFNKEPKVSMLTFRKELAREFLHNPFIKNIQGNKISPRILDMYCSTYQLTKSSKGPS